MMPNIDVHPLIEPSCNIQICIFPFIDMESKMKPASRWCKKIIPNGLLFVIMIAVAILEHIWITAPPSI